jgi:exo-beta-1,3-glucanase (GH17 family)
MKSLRDTAQLCLTVLRPFVWSIAALIFSLFGQVPSKAIALTSPFSSTVGVSYSKLFAQNPLPVDQVMRQIKQNFSLVRFYDFNQEFMTEAAAQGLEIILTVPNEKLTVLDSLTSAQTYAATYVVPWKDYVKAVIVGNEIFDNGDQGQSTLVVGRMQNLALALQNAGLSHIAVTTNINLDALAVSWPVDQAVFQTQYKTVMSSILTYLGSASGPGFVFVNTYPWQAIQQNPPPTITIDYATFQGPGVCYSNGNQCQNLFQAQYLAWNYAVQALLPGNKTVAYIGETGWPSAGGTYPNLSSESLEGDYINGYIRWVKSQSPQIPSLLFEMYDEPLKSGGEEEKHFGLFNENGSAKFQLVNDNVRLATGNFDGGIGWTAASVTAGTNAAATAAAYVNNDVVGVTPKEQIFYALGNEGWQYLWGRLAQIAGGDVNGDGRDDIVGLTVTGGIYYTENVADWHWVPGVLSQMDVCDLNGDGREDLVGVTLEGEIYYSLDLTNWQTLPGILHQLTCADFNGDGSNDLAGITRTGDIYYTLDRQNWQNLPGKLAQLSSGRINLGNQADLVGVTCAGQIFYTLNLRDWMFVPGTLSQVTVGNLNSDLKGDLIGLTADGSIYFTTDLGTWQQKDGRF